MNIWVRLMAIVLAILCPACRLTEKDLPNGQEYTSDTLSTEGRHSIFAWDLYLFNEGAFPSLSKVLTAYEIDRVYQAIPAVYFNSFEVSSMVTNCAAMDIEVVALNGDPSWQSEGLNAYYAWIDALCAYNQSHPSEAIRAVALDVESHTMESFQEDMTKGFSSYVELMREAYLYAHERGLSVVQVIPTMFDIIDIDKFEWFIQNCCDELSVMNYEKDGAVNNIKDEILLCKKNGVRIESIFETMPISDPHHVTAANTYFDEGEAALRSAVKELQSTYGPSLGIGYHYFNTLYYLYSGEYLAEIYIYADPDNPYSDVNSQVYVGETVQLKSENGDSIAAWVFNPNRNIDRQEYCYLAVGVHTGLQYHLQLEDETFTVYSPKTFSFHPEYGKIIFTEAIGVRS